MRILVLGAGGMMGHMACRVLSGRHDVVGTIRSGFDPDAPLARFVRPDQVAPGVDALRLDSVVETVGRVRPDAIVNCVGIVKQLPEAADTVLSVRCNALLPHQLSLLAEAVGARLIHLSTDCVFSGRRGSYTLDDIPDPVDVYGRSKLLGETASGPALTLRTSIVGRQLDGHASLFDWAIGQAGKPVRGFTRAVYTGLTTMALARVIDAVLVEHPRLDGVWQVASEPVTKFDLISELDRRLGLGLDISPDAHYFCDRSLDGSAFVAATGIRTPSWDEMLAEFVSDQASYRGIGVTP